MDINNLSQKELADLISQANKRKKVLAKRKPINQVRAAVNRVVRTSGYTMEELFGTARSVAGTRKAPAAKKTAARKAASKVAPISTTKASSTPSSLRLSVMRRARERA